jgi:GMP synthase (glutamine-hydrolysing)
MMTEPVVLVVDFGAQYAQLIARRVREARVYSEIVPHTMPVEEILARRPAAIILSGGPASIYTEGAPDVDPALLATGVPTFGICYGFHAMAQALGGTVARTGLAEFGRTALTVTEPGAVLFRDLPVDQLVWMSHGDEVSQAPEGFVVTATSAGAAVAAFEAVDRGLAGVQFHPEVLHTAHGQEVLEHFLYDIAHLEPTWTMDNVIEEQVAAIRAAVGDKRVLCGLSGGVDSAVAAALVQRAVGDHLTCVFVDHGLLRAGEAEQVERDFVAATGVDLKVVDAQDRFLDALAGVSDPEEKRKIIGREFIRVFEAAAREVIDDAGTHGDSVDFLVQGTLYPDIVESGGRHRHGQHQEPPQRRGPARRPRVRPGGAAALAVQRRGAPGRPRAGPARGDRVAPALPRAGAGHPHRRRGHPGSARGAPGGRRHRPRGALGGRARP